MPIKPENKARYPKDWKSISKRVRDRAGNKCEQCAAPNGEMIVRDNDGTYMLEGGEVFDDQTGEWLGLARGSEYNADRMVRIVLTVAHLDHTPENCADDNLKALCQKCHLAYDHDHHKANSARTRRNHTEDMFERTKNV